MSFNEPPRMGGSERTRPRARKYGHDLLTCSVQGCEEPVRCIKGTLSPRAKVCQKHSVYWKRHGSYNRATPKLATDKQLRLTYHAATEIITRDIRAKHRDAIRTASALKEASKYLDHPAMTDVANVMRMAPAWKYRYYQVATLRRKTHATLAIHWAALVAVVTLDPKYFDSKQQADLFLVKEAFKPLPPRSTDILGNPVRHSNLGLRTAKDMGARLRGEYRTSARQQILITRQILQPVKHDLN